MGIYSLGQGVSLISDFFGGKVMFPRGGVTPYAMAGLGGGYFSAGSGGASAFGTRFGGGVTIPMTDSLSWRVEYSRINFRLRTSLDSPWTGGNNFSAGIVFTVSN
jgi:opacity protein-like surface antigen